MPIITIDTEHVHDGKRSLRKMSVLQYLKCAPILGAAYIIDDSKPEWLAADNPRFMEWIMWLKEEVAGDPNWTWVAHNTSFDWRSLRYGRLSVDAQPLGVPHPLISHDSMAMSRAAWPGQPIVIPGGKSYSLANIAAWLGLPPKLSMEDAKRGVISWEEYCCRDVVLGREVYKKALPRMSADEILAMEMCERLKGLHLEVVQDKVQDAIESFSKMSTEEMMKLVSEFGEDGQNMFGMDEETKELRSVKPHKVKEMLLKHFEFATDSISLKKNAESAMAACPGSGAVMKSTSVVNKALSHKRRVARLTTTPIIPIELQYFGAANTGRSSGTSAGRGYNLLNVPKRGPVGKAMREMLVLPDDLCWVRADAAAVEYRVEAYLTDCEYVTKMFENDINAEAYGNFMREGTGYQIKGKKDPLRQDLAKVVVLGGGYGCGNAKMMSVIAAAQAASLTNKDPSKHLTDEMLHSMAATKGWKVPPGRFFKKAQTDAGCSDIVALTAYHMRLIFHRLHHEYFTVAKWLFETLEGVASALDPEEFIDLQYQLHGAPDRRKIDLQVDKTLESPTIRVTLDGWSMPTVTWRNIGTHEGCNGLAMYVPNKGARDISPNVLIENVSQSCARNMLNRARLNLEARGWPYVMDVYDELLVLCPKNAADIRRCRDDILESSRDFGWVFYLNPSEITVTKSLYEDEAHTQKLFAAIDQGLPCDELLATLP
jgi:hypothetical protein